jgi:predicted transcriptional regulator
MNFSTFHLHLRFHQVSSFNPNQHPPKARRASGRLATGFGTFESNSIDLDQFKKYRHAQRIVVMPQSTLEMAKELVLAQIQTGTLLPEDTQGALHRVFQSLLTLKSREEAELSMSAAGTAPAPADWRTSITRHAIKCLECGQIFKQLTGRHLRQHNLNARSYRAKYGIPGTQPLSARATAALRRRQIVAAVKPWEKSPTYMKGQQAKAATAKKSGRKKGTRKR